MSEQRDFTTNCVCERSDAHGYEYSEDYIWWVSAWKEALTEDTEDMCPESTRSTD